MSLVIFFKAFIEGFLSIGLLECFPKILGKLLA